MEGFVVSYDHRAQWALLRLLCSPLVHNEKGRRPWVCIHGIHGLGLRPSCEFGCLSPGAIGCVHACRSSSPGLSFVLSHTVVSLMATLFVSSSLSEGQDAFPPTLFFFWSLGVTRSRNPFTWQCSLPALLSPGHKITWLSCFSYPLETQPDSRKRLCFW